MNKLLALLTLATFAASSFALSFDDIKLWAGTGSHKAALVIDFANSGGTPYAWGYRFDGDKTGLDMIKAIDALDPNLSFDIVSYSFGDAVNGITYGSLSQSGFIDNSYWSYWTSTSSTNWSSSWVGAGDRSLANGDWDGWSWGDGSTAPRDNAVAAVPEPATLIALGFGTLLLRRKRK